jgi:hypothetical protein
MQIDYNSDEMRSNTHMLHLLMEDLFERKPEVRYDQLCNQLRERIMMTVIEEARKQNLTKKHVRVVVNFTEPAGDFSLNYSLEPMFLKDLEEYVKVIGGCTKALLSTLRKEHNLDDVELVEIKVYEYHDITKGF